MGSKSATKVEKSKKADKKVEKAVKAEKPAKVEKKDKKSEKKDKKKKKEPTPEPESESSSSESESDSDSDSSDSESEDEKPAAKKAESSSSDSDSSDSESEDEKPAAKKEVAKKAASPSSSSSSSDSDSDSSDEDAAEEAAVIKAEDKKDASDSSSDSDSDSSSDEEEEKPAATNGKRKAEEEEESAPAAPKKAKVEADGDATNTVFVGGLSWNIDNDWLASEFASCGEVVSARVMLDRETNRSRGFGYVEFADLDAAAKAIESDGREIDGRNVRVNYASKPTASTEKRAKVFNDKQSDPAETLWVGSLSFDITEDQVYETFGEYGDVQSVRLPTDRETGAPKGFGYVQFGDVAQATAALEALNGQEVAGRRIRIDYAPPKNNDGQGGFGGGRGGGFGGRGGGRGGGFGGRGGGGFGGRGGGRGGGGCGGFGGRGRGAPRGGARTGGIVESQGNKVTFD